MKAKRKKKIEHSVVKHYKDIMESIPKSVLNKYTVSLAVFVFFALFYSGNSISEQFSVTRDINRLEAEKARYLSEIEKLRNQLEAIDNDPLVVEKVARERYFLKRPNEDVFIIEEEK